LGIQSSDGATPNDANSSVDGARAGGHLTFQEDYIGSSWHSIVCGEQ
jgi:hypothetical protein